MTVGISMARRYVGPDLSSVRLINDSTMIEIAEDWSEVRSPGRARRRRRQGHAQRIQLYQRPMRRVIQTPDGLRGHPEFLGEMMKAVGDRARGIMDRQAMAAVRGVSSNAATV